LKRKQEFYNTASLALIFAMVAYILYDPQAAKLAASYGYEIWLKSVMPAVFPFFVLTAYINKAGYSAIVSSALAPAVNKVLGISGNGAFAYISAIFSGNPLGTKLVCDLYKEGKLDRNEAHILLALCGNIGPVFILSTVGLVFFSSIRIGCILLAIDYLSAIITALFLSLRYEKMPLLTLSTKQAPPSRAKAFVEAVKDSVMAVLNIGGFLIFFQVVISFWQSIAGSSASILNATISAFLEVTSGTELLGALRASEPLLTLILASAAVCFGGLSIFFQCMSYITETDLRIGSFIKAKAIQTAIGATLGAAAATMLPDDISAFYEMAQDVPAFVQRPQLIPISFGVFAFATAFLYLLASHKRSHNSIR